MRILYKYLSDYKVKLVCCVLALLLQTVSCLVMPFLMGNFINIGIQQKGIKETVPYAVTEEAMDLFSKIIPAEEYQTYKNSYELRKEAPTNAPEYLLDCENRYFLKDFENTDDVKEIYNNAVVAALIFVQENFPQVENIDINALYEYVSFTFVYNKLKDENIDPEIVQEVYAKSESTGDAVKTQIASMLLPFIYEDTGVDLEETQQKYMFKSGLLMLLCAAVQISSMLFVHRKASFISAEIENSLRNRIMNHSSKFGKRELSIIPPNQITSAIITDVEQVGMIVNYFIKFFMYAPFLAIGGAIVSLSKNLFIGILILMTAVIIVIALLIVFKLTEKRYEIMDSIYSKLSSLFKINIEQVLTMRSLNAEKTELKKVETLSNENRLNEQFVLRSVFVAFSIINLITNAVVAVIIVLGGNNLLASSLNLGDMVAFIQYALLTVSAFMIVGASIAFSPRAIIAMKNIDAVLSVEIVVEDKGEVVDVNDDWNIRFENIVLNGVPNGEFTFDIHSGEKIGITGPTGCGKSSLMDLLLRNDIATKGNIYISGHKIEDFKMEYLRKNISYSQGTGVLFTKTLRENLMLYGCENNDEVMNKALEMAECSFLPVNSLDRVIMNAGSNFSGGQKSRLAIAGAMGKNAKVYIFDDCFTALDSNTEEKILSNLLNIKKDATIVIISQSIKSIKNCDRIIVLSQNGVESQGTHSELLEKSSYYRMIVSNQSGEV